VNKTGWNAVRFLSKHAVAGAVVAGGSVALTVAAYCVLLIAAVLFEKPMGSPATLPLIALMVLVVALASVLLVLLPVTAGTEWLCDKRRIHLALQVPIAAVLLMAYVLAAAMAIAVFRGTSIATATRVALGISAALSVPLLVYWLALQSTGWLIRVLAGLSGRLRPPPA
jgi:hypothetical protein